MLKIEVTDGQRLAATFDRLREVEAELCDARSQVAVLKGIIGKLMEGEQITTGPAEVPGE